MGLFAKFVYSNGQWGGDATGDQYLAIDIHDSDVATIDYRPATGQGRFYLGFQPRDYFGEPDASAPIDAGEEASLFAGWAEQVLGVEVTAAELRPLLADAGEEDPDDAFVEDTVERLVTLLGLPVPPGLRDGGDS